MTILCHKEFAETCRFAAEVDIAYLKAQTVLNPVELRDQMEAGRQMGSRSLLFCLGLLALYDNQYNENPMYAQNFRPETYVVGRDGLKRTVGKEPNVDALPRRETFLFVDIAPHSFFFREEFIDPLTRQVVTVVDQVYYVFRDPKSRGLDQAAIDVLSQDDLHLKALNRECEVFYSLEDASKAMDAGNSILRHIERERHGMCGGVIYHPDYKDGNKAPYGRWSTHT